MRPSAGHDGKSLLERSLVGQEQRLARSHDFRERRLAVDRDPIETPPAPVLDATLIHHDELGVTIAPILDAVHGHARRANDFPEVRHHDLRDDLARYSPR